MQCSAIEVQRGRWADRKKSKDDILKLYLVDQMVICLFDMNMNIVARDQGAEDSRTEEEKDRSCVNAAMILEALLLIVSATER